jgi:glycosyltransferase involved in cell wall biosynthesis/SAM-dependent methyltransferase
MSEPLNIATIVAKNYLAQARTLVESYRNYNSEGKAFVLLADRIDDYPYPSSEDFEIIKLDELSNEIPDLEAFCFKYTILELSTALKPYFLNYIFNKFKVQKLAYFDPDILITRDLAPVSGLLDKYNIILTPHITTPFSDNYKPSDLDILRSGAYNLGFIALTNSKVTLSMLDWWKEHLYKECVVDFSEGLFVDQRWIDLVPGLFPGTYILRDCGYNVAYWNLHERTITIENQQFYCNGEPLYFFHFSGYDLDHPKEISKHQNRYSFSQIGQASNIFSLYSNLLVKNGYHEVKKWPYAFAHFDNGVVIPDFIRRIFLNFDENKALSFGNPFEASSSKSFFRWLTDIDESGLSPILREIYYIRPDIRKAFPDIEGKDHYAFLQWVINDGKIQYNLSDDLLKNVYSVLKNNKDYKKGAFFKNLSFRYLYREGKIRLLYYRLRRYPVIGPLLNLIKPFIVHKVKNKQQFFLSTEQVSRKEKNDSMKPKETSESNTKICHKFGINLAGYIKSEKGMGEAVRSDIRCLQAANIPFVLNNFIDSGSENKENVAGFSEDNPYNINLIHINADQFPSFVQRKSQTYLQGRYNIGYWAWELPHFPEEWQEAFQYLDEIWVPSNFVQNSVAKVSPLPVITIPHSVERKIVSTKFDRKYFGLPVDTFIFLFIFDFDSFMARKNPIGLVNAFKNAFLKNENVTLVIKCSHSDHYPEDLQLLKEKSRETNIKIIDDVFTREEVDALLALSDCYVSLHRSEGFGLTIAEAMSMGKPVIATGYSGNMDFMTPWNSFIVKYKLVEIDRDYGPYKKGWLWAEPDLDEASRLMRYVFKDKEKAMAIGQAAKEHIGYYFSSDSIGKVYQKRLSTIDNLINSDRKIYRENYLDIKEKNGLSQDYEGYSASDNWIKIENKLSDAAKVSQVGEKLPGMYKLHGLKREIATFVGKIVLRVAQIITRDQRTFNSSIIDILRAVGIAIKNIESTVMEKSGKVFEEHLASQETRFLKHTDYINQRIDSLELAKSKQENSLSSILNRVDTLTDQVIPGQKMETLDKIDNLESQLKATLEDLNYLKNGLLLQEQRQNLLLEEVHNRLSDPFSLEQINSFHEKSNDYDTLYMQLEDQFRGTREDIMERQRVYLPIIRDAGAGTEDRPVLDLGCGRGEWLEILKEEGLIAKGVDINRSMILYCNKLGVEVFCDDLLKYISGLPSESLGAVTGFHIVEHLLFDKLIQLIDETVRVLKPGGVAIFETPNPENVMVGSCNFYLDPTHRNPLPSSLLKFLFGVKGLCRIEVINLHPYPDSFRLSGSDLAERFNQLFYSSQDYAMIGWKS